MPKPGQFIPGNFMPGQCMGVRPPVLQYPWVSRCVFITSSTNIFNALCTFKFHPAVIRRLLVFCGQST